MNAIHSNSTLLIGINGDWNALLHMPKRIDSNTYSVNLDSAHKNEIVKIKKDLAKSKVYLMIHEDGKNTIIDNDCFYQGEDLKIFFLDINGDGKLEIITYTSGCAGGIGVYSYDHGKVSNMLGIDLGE